MSQKWISRESCFEDRHNLCTFTLATDCHLGYSEKDQVRGNDSLSTFEEILQIAKDKKVGTYNNCFPWLYIISDIYIVDMYSDPRRIILHGILERKIWLLFVRTRAPIVLSYHLITFNCTNNYKFVNIFKMIINFYNRFLSLVESQF